MVGINYLKIKELERNILEQISEEKLLNKKPFLYTIAIVVRNLRTEKEIVFGEWKIYPLEPFSSDVYKDVLHQILIRWERPLEKSKRVEIETETSYKKKTPLSAVEITANGENLVDVLKQIEFKVNALLCFIECLQKIAIEIFGVVCKINGNDGSHIYDVKFFNYEGLPLEISYESPTGFENMFPQVIEKMLADNKIHHAFYLYDRAVKERNREMRIAELWNLLEFIGEQIKPDANNVEKVKSILNKHSVKYTDEEIKEYFLYRNCARHCGGCLIQGKEGTKISTCLHNHKIQLELAIRNLDEKVEKILGVLVGINILK